ncbi:MAG: dTDP-4-dehydrorhamnose 3,5-epimerase [Desulfovibrio sp.]|jgi:dTDP-4-dehydrorhamnose 3,5-epimerase|nr:dTDP-4-dehydrorhamnose 3,5-epimerase [Desulfovibrio sp.]
MDVTATEIDGLLIVRLAAHRDRRGFFMETWRAEWEKRLRVPRPFVQDNLCRSEAAGVVRGLHFQRPPATQAKLVWVGKGAAYDAAVDLRLGSPTYGQWYALVLSEDNMLRFYVPEGFAHGYMTLEAGTEFHYKVGAYYSPEHEDGIRFDDPALGIPWPKIPPLVSEKDEKLPSLAELQSPFSYGKAELQSPFSHGESGTPRRRRK